VPVVDVELPLQGHAHARVHRSAAQLEMGDQGSRDSTDDIESSSVCSRINGWRVYSRWE